MNVGESLAYLTALDRNSERSLATYLEVYGFLNQHLVLTYSGSVVAFWEITGLDPEGLTLAEKRRHADWFSRQLQVVDREALVMTWVVRDVVAMDAEEGNHPVYRALAVARKKRETFFVNRHVIAVEWPFARAQTREGVTGSLLKAVGKAQRGEFGTMLRERLRRRRQAKEKVLDIEEARLETFLRETVMPGLHDLERAFQPLGPQPMAQQAIYRFLLQLYNPDPAKGRLRLVAPAPLNYLLEASDVTYEKRHLQVDGVWMDMLSLRQVGKHTLPHWLEDLEALDFPLVIGTTWRRMDDDKAARLIKMQKRGFTHRLRFGSGDSIKEGYRDAVVGDLDAGLTELKTEGRWFGQLSVFILLRAESLEELASRKGRVASLLYERDLQIQDEDMGLVFAWASLCPGGFWKHNHRRLMLTNGNAADFAPIWRAGVGLPESPAYGGKCLSVLETRSGSPYCFNLCRSDNLNWLALGKIGSGKSYFIKYHILQYLKYGPCWFWIHTLGRDYHDLALMCGGQVVEIDPDGQYPINLYCLSETLTPGYRNALLAIWQACAAALGVALAEPQLRELSEKLDILFHQPVERRNNRALLRLVGPDLAHMVAQFVHDHEIQGRFGKLFDGAGDDPRCLRSLPRFLVVDYQKLTKVGALSEAVMIFLTYLQDLIIDAEAYRGEGKFFWLDEGHKVLGERDGYMWRYVNRMGDTGRKQKLSLGFITQKLADLKALGLDTLFRECCSQFLFFPNPGLDGEGFLETFDFLSEADVALIRGAREKAEVVYVTSDQVRKVLRLRTDPFTDLVLDSRPDIVMAKNRLFQEVGFPENIHRLLAQRNQPIQTPKHQDHIGLLDGDHEDQGRGEA